MDKNDEESECENIIITLKEPQNCEVFELLLGNMILIERELAISDAASLPIPIEHESLQGRT